MAKQRKWIWTTLAILGIVGGAVHVLQPFGANLLEVLPFAKFIQFVAGASAIIYIGKKLMK